MADSCKKTSLKNVSIQPLSSKVRSSTKDFSKRLSHERKIRTVARNRQKSFKLRPKKFLTLRGPIMAKKLLTVLLILAFGPCFGQSRDNSSIQDLSSKLSARGVTCVQSVKNEKVYLNPSKIFPTEEGLFLALDSNEFILLNNLNSDVEGCYLHSYEIFNRCRWCNQPYFIRCKNPACPGKPNPEAPKS